MSHDTVFLVTDRQGHGWGVVWRTVVASSKADTVRDSNIFDLLFPHDEMLNEVAEGTDEAVPPIRKIMLDDDADPDEMLVRLTDALDVHGEPAYHVWRSMREYVTALGFDWNEAIRGRLEIVENRDTGESS